ncbi:MAG: DUF2127 domain-containing protein [Candidatus Angelobacter sp.]
MNTQKNLIAKHFGLRGIAVLEAGKGVLGVVVGIWLLTLLHKDLESVAAHLLRFLHKVLHLSPDGHIARTILHGAARVNHHNLHVWALLAFAYATIRFVEGAGLWLEKEWAEWFALVSGAMYMPYEVYELILHPTAIKWGILAINALIVFYLAWLLRDSYMQRKLRELPVSPQTEPVP